MTTVITVILCVIAMIVAAVIASIVSVNRFKKSADEKDLRRKRVG